ncbi:MAG TPA: hypothetical protein VHR86_10175 [Armatimonadota bacterium]|nr:hypothetical protein [Armatimonadota bacterium]
MKGSAAVHCERCGFENPEGTVVCVQCYYAVGVPYQANAKGGKKGNQKMPAWATEMGLNEYEVRQVLSQLGDTAKGDILAYWFAKPEDAAETQKALADTIGKDIQDKKAKVGVFSVQGRNALFVAGKISDTDTVRMVCDSFSGESALGKAAPAAAAK